MASEFSGFHDELRAVARAVLGAVPADSPIDWEVVAGSGWAGLEVPERLDGAGVTFAEVAVILEELGRCAALSPYLGSVALGIGALSLVEPDAGRDGLLRSIAAGDTVVAVAVGEDGGAGFRVERSVEGRLTLRGSMPFVADAPVAQRLLLVATGWAAGDDPAPPSPGGVAEATTRGLAGDTPVLVELNRSAARPSITDQPVLDATRRFGIVVADGVEVKQAQIRRFVGDPHVATGRLRDRATLAVALDSLGIGEAMLAATVAYAKVREQFGRPIGSFQAVKHACADMLVQLTIARELCDAAVERVACDLPDASAAVAMAKSYTCAAAVGIAGAAMQLHGGIGYTWESGIHRFLKRAALNRALFGSAAEHRRRIAARYR